MGFLKFFKTPKAKLELQFDEIGNEVTKELTGRMVIEPQEEITVDELRLEFDGVMKVRWPSGKNRLPDD